MKLYLLALFLALTGATFMDFLSSLQSHHSFLRLPEEERLLFGELVVAAENDELAEFIDRVGFVRVLRLMDHMSHTDAEIFAAYLAEHSNYTHHAAEKTTLSALMQAAAKKNITQFIRTTGYGSIFGLFAHLDDHHSYEISRLIENSLAAESGPSGGQAKRASTSSSSSSSHHSNILSYLSSLNSMYFEHLPEEERQVYHDLTAAAKHHNITGYIDTHGYGPIFGFLEHLDYFHAQQTYSYLTHALNAEAAAISGGDED